MRNPKWHRDEIILALDLHFKTKLGSISASNTEIVALSEILNKLRNPVKSQTLIFGLCHSALTPNQAEGFNFELIRTYPYFIQKFINHIFVNVSDEKFHVNELLIRPKH